MPSSSEPKSSPPINRIVCALDVDTSARAAELVQQLQGKVGVFKVGLELMTSAGAQIVPHLRALGASRIFYDAKLHDIPNTVAGAMRGVVRLGVWCVTVHATGGSAMLRAAVETARTEALASGMPRPKVLAVTVLTSIDDSTLQAELMVPTSAAQFVPHLARLAYEAGCDGVIASPHEIRAVRAAVPESGFLIITPGVRPRGSARDDQARVTTPEQAVRDGADYVVIGRPIVQAADPGNAAADIAAQLDSLSDL